MTHPVMCQDIDKKNKSCPNHASQKVGDKWYCRIHAKYASKVHAGGVKCKKDK